MSDRYEGNPWRRVLDSFMLWTIGALDESSAAQLDAMAPKLLQTFGMASGSWQDVVTTQMALDDNYVEWLRSRWAAQLAHDDDIGQDHEPVAWATAMADLISSEPTQPS